LYKRHTLKQGRQLNRLQSVKSLLGITTLEEKYQLIVQKAKIDSVHLLRYAERARAVQSEMREVLNQLTPHLCSHCEHNCCEGAPIEGWFSLEDYVLFRVKYGMPTIPTNRIRRDNVCSFLTPEGCSLPENMRPFSCVKVNCENLKESLNTLGKVQQFNQLKDSLDDIQWEVHQLITRNNLIPSPYKYKRGTYKK